MSAMMLDENTGRKGFNPQNSQWRIWNMWASRTSILWNNYCMGETDLKQIRTDRMETLFSSVIDSLDGASSDFPGELFLKQSRMFLVQPFTEDRFVLNKGNCQFELDGKELFQTSDSEGKSGQNFEIVSYDELAVILEKSFINSEIWIVHGGVVVQPSNCRKRSDCSAPSSLQLNYANLRKPVQVLRIRIEANETSLIELLLEDFRPTRNGLIKFTYTAKAGIKTVEVTRTRETRSNYDYETSLDRWFFPILASTDARKGYIFLLSNNWNKDPCWSDGAGSISSVRSKKSAEDGSSKLTSPIFTTKYVEDEVINRRKTSQKNGQKRFKSGLLWGFLVILVLLLVFINQDKMEVYYPAFGIYGATNNFDNSTCPSNEAEL